MQNLLVCFCVVLIFGCGGSRNSPFSDQTAHTQADLNVTAVGEIKQINKSVLRIAVFTDPHQNYVDLVNIVGKINSFSDIDFVVSLGDFTNSGYNVEFDQFLDSYLKIEPPALSLIGNHDALGAGMGLYKRIFGPPSFFFENSNRRFIFFNSAKLESPEDFHPKWLLESVEGSDKKVIVFTHIPLTDANNFDQETLQIFEQVIDNPKVQTVVNGHNNVYSLGAITGTHLIQVPRVENSQWILFTLEKSRLRLEIFPAGEIVWLSLK